MDLELTLRRLAQEAGLWTSLQNSGFFLLNYADHEFRISQLMVDLGYVASDFASEDLFESVHPDDEGHYRDLWQRVVHGWENIFDVEYRLRNRLSNEWVWIQSHGVVVSRVQGKVAIFLGVDQNITGRKDAEALLRQQLFETETVFQQSESLRVASMLAHSSLDLDKTIQLVLTQAHGTVPFEKAAVSGYDGTRLHVLGVKAEADEPPGVPERPASHPVWAVLTNKSPSLQDDLGVLDPPFPGDPDRRYRSWLGIPLIFRHDLLGVLEFWHRDPGFFRSQQVWPAMGFADSVAESLSNSRKYEELKEDARTDPLTGLFSRRHLQATGPGIVDTSVRDRRPFAVLLLDIDHFKEVNDHHGHLVGDAILMTTAQLCRTLLRKDDLFFRFGGEEFLAILPNTEDQVADRIAERLRATVALARFRDMTDPITISVGVAPVAPGRIVTLEELIDEADQAMYQAKASGRNRVVTSARWTDLPPD